MRTIIIGAGVVGLAVAEQLSIEGHHVAFIDSDRRKLRDVSDKLDVLAVYGNATSESVLERAGIEQADMLIAVTNTDEVNLIAGMMAKRYGVKQCIIRVRNNELQQDAGILPLADVGVDQVINPEPVIVDALMRMIEIPGAHDLATLGDGDVLMLGFDIAEDSPAAGKKLADLREVSALNAFLILYIVRGEEFIVPKGDDQILPGDNIHLLVSADTVPFVLPIIHRHPLPVKRVIVAGATRIGIALAREFSDRVDRVIMIEPDSQKAEEVANELAKVTVIKGEPTDLSILQEASVDACDLFCAVSDDDRQNMMTALMAKKAKAAQTAVLVSDPAYVTVLDSLGVEIVINPRLVTVGQILEHVRRGLIYSVTRIAESRAEIIELEATEGCAITKGELKHVHFPEGAIVGAYLRDGIMQIPTGDTKIQPHDRVFVFTLPEAVIRIEKLFGAGKNLK
ncbi:Trk system potassium transporter TrkA [Myxococcota bacterium]|nr:Trk system potassium transporter TrkA [Myxococcota bacterium]